MSAPYVLTISPANSIAATGLQWQFAKRFAREHGVPIWTVGRKSVIPAAALLAALERAAATSAAEPVDELAQARHAMGLEVCR